MYTYIHYVLNYSLHTILFIITTVYDCILRTVYLNKTVLTYQLVKNDCIKLLPVYHHTHNVHEHLVTQVDRMLAADLEDLEN